MALPLIIGAISAVASLFDAGKQVYEAVSGKPSTATSPTELRTEVEALPPEQKAQWAEAMQHTLAMHKSENERLKIEQGELSAELLALIPEKDRADIARERMTIRPWVVRGCTRVVFLPVYLTAYDAVAMVLNGPIRFFTGSPFFDLFAEKVFGEGSLYVTTYQWAAPIAASVLVTYMSLKTIEIRRNGHANGNGVGAAIEKAIGAVRGVIARK